MLASVLNSDLMFFAKAFATAPRRVSAVAPSGAALAELITSEIDPRHGPVLELGPGTGVFTEALIARGIDEADLTLIEYGADFARLLADRFPAARILRADAARLAAQALFPHEKAGAVVSGLPLLSMPPRKIASILIGTFAHLRTGGALYQFTYGPRCPVPRPLLDRLGLKATFVGRALANIPPAAVYRITRRAPLRVLAA